MKAITERLIIVGLLILCAFLGVRGCNEQVKEKIVLKDNFIQKTDSLQHYKDQFDREHGKRVMAEADRASITAVYRVEIDSLQKALSIKDNQLESFAMMGTTSSGNVRLKVDTVFVDSSNRYNFSYKDKWLDIAGTISDQSSLNYIYSDSLIISSYWKRAWFLGKKTNYIDAYSLNPNVRITGMQGVKVSGSVPGRFGVGPYVGFGYNGSGWKPSIGVSLQYSLIRF